MIALAWHEAFRDAAMISMRYARNLVHGHGLVWNLGGTRVEGSASAGSSQDADRSANRRTRSRLHLGVGVQPNGDCVEPALQFLQLGPQLSAS